MRSLWQEIFRVASIAGLGNTCYITVRYWPVGKDFEKNLVARRASKCEKSTRPQYIFYVVDEQIVTKIYSPQEKFTRLGRVNEPILKDSLRRTIN